MLKLIVLLAVIGGENVGLFKSENPKEKEHRGIVGSFSVDNIRWEPESEQAQEIIVHKFQYEDFPNGSLLTVAPSQTAVFINNLSAGDSLANDGSGEAQVAVFRGPCSIRLATGDSRFAPFRNVAHKLTDGMSAFHSYVYFFNNTYMNELNWGTREPILVQDPEEDVNVHVRAHGLYGVHMEQNDPVSAARNSRKFLERVVGTQANYSRAQFEEFMRAKILEYVPNLLAKSIVENNVGVLKISTQLTSFSDQIYRQLIPFFDEFGYTLDNFSFHSINVPDEDLRIVNEMKIKRKAMQLEAEGKAMKMDLESAAMARKREREGYSYQQEQAFGVMGTAAGNEGTSSTFMGAGMGLGMGVGMGGAIGHGFQNMAQQTVFGTDLYTPVKPQTQNNAGAGEAVCPSCGNSNPAGAKFCLHCGEKIAQGIKCANCGADLPAHAKFCLECGAKVNSGPAVCPGCGAEIVPGSKFCLECGTKL